MARITTVPPESATGMRRLIIWSLKRKYGGFLPGIMRILLADLTFGKACGRIYDHLHLSKSSRLTRLQREMLATVVNGKIGGAP